MTTQLDDFEARLLTELRQEVGRATPVAPRPRRRTVVALAGVAAAAVAGVVLVPGLGTSAAYSVQEGNSGEIQVEITRPEDAAGLERALAEHGIAADVTFLHDDESCGPGRFVEVDRDVGMSLVLGTHLVRVTLPPGAVRDGETFVMELSVRPMTADELDAVGEEEGTRNLDGTHASVSAEVASGPVAPCNPR